MICYGAAMIDRADRLQLEVHDMEVPVLTGIYSEETHLPQPLRISLTVDLDLPDRFAPDTPLGRSTAITGMSDALIASMATASAP